jgi:dUTP pyrophosphatase
VTDQLIYELTNFTAFAPVFATPGSAAFDLASPSAFILEPGQYKLQGIGVKILVPDGFALLIYGRSGLTKRKIRVPSTGVVDSDYRGELFVGLENQGKEDYVVQRGDRIAQAILTRLHSFELVSGRVPNDTARGTSGFGSTGR